MKTREDGCKQEKMDVNKRLLTTTNRRKMAFFGYMLILSRL